MLCQAFLLFLKIAILMLACHCPCTPLKISLPKNKTMVNLESASFVVIMLLHECLTHIHSQIKRQVAFWREFYFNGNAVNRLKY